MASRTPKHMPRCSARIILTAALSMRTVSIALCVAKLDSTEGDAFIFLLLLRFGLPDYLFQQINIMREGATACRCQRTGCQGPLILISLRDRDKTSFLQRF